MGIRSVAVITTAVLACAAVAGVFHVAKGSADTSPKAAPWGITSTKLGGAVAPAIPGTSRVVLYADSFTTTYLDNAPTGTSVGDAITGFGLLTTAEGQTAGELDIHEVMVNDTNPNALRILIQGTARTQSGQLSVSGVQLSTQQGARLAVIGGTGKYWNVRGGQVTGGAASGGRVKLTFLLIRR